MTGGREVYLFLEATWLAENPMESAVRRAKYELWVRARDALASLLSNAVHFLHRYCYAHEA